MGIDFDNLKKKAEDLVKEHGDQIESGVDKAADFAKGRFGHDETVDKVAGKIKGLIPDDPEPSGEESSQA